MPRPEGTTPPGVCFSRHSRRRDRSDRRAEPMAAPELNRAHQQDIRAKIKTTQLVNRLQAFALGEKAPNATEDDGRLLELDAARLKAIEILLRKSLPDLSAVTHQGDPDAPLVMQVLTGVPRSED